MKINNTDQLLMTMRLLSIQNSILNHYAPRVYYMKMQCKLPRNRMFNEAERFPRLYDFFSKSSTFHIYVSLKGVTNAIDTLSKKIDTYLENNLEIDNYPEIKESANSIINKAKFDLHEYEENIKCMDMWIEQDLDM